MYQIVFYVPENHKEQVKEAMFAKGAGQIGDYGACAWEVLGTGQFLPQSNSNPYLGKQGQLEKVAEFKVEMVCKQEHLQDVLKALHEAHPYEEPAYRAYKIETLSTYK